MERTNVMVGCGAPLGDDGIWLSGPGDVEPEETDRLLSMQFEQRRFLLVNHLYLFRKKGLYFRTELNLVQPRDRERTQWKGGRGVLT